MAQYSPQLTAHKYSKRKLLVQLLVIVMSIAKQYIDEELRAFPTQLQIFTW